MTGVFVMVGGIDPASSNLGMWIAIGALAIGVALLPWGRRHRANSAENMSVVVAGAASPEGGA